MGDVSLNQPMKAEPAAAPAGGYAQGNRTLDPMSVGWTDERHMRYIKSMEASFVNQLHNPGHDSLYTNGNAFKLLQGPPSPCFGKNKNGFKVLRGDVWEYIKYDNFSYRERSSTRYRLPANPWIQHFRPRRCSSNVKSDVLEDSEGDYESGTQTARKRTCVSRGRKKGACNGETQLRVETTEVSDQNFADGEVEVDAESSKRNKKRRFSSTEMLNDQVNSQG